MSSEESIKINTNQFGEIFVDKDQIFNFDDGLLGFEELKDYVLISDEDTEPLKWLLSVENPEIGFPMLSPWHIDLAYEPGRDFNLSEDVVLAVVTLEDGHGRLTANLKAPVILNIETLKGKQIILTSDKYSPNHIIHTKG